MRHELTDDFNVPSALSALLHPLSLSSRLNIFLPNPSARLLAACPEPIQQSRTNSRSFIHFVFAARAGCTQPRSAKSSSQTLEREWTSSSLSVSLSHTNAPRRGVQLSAALSKCRWARRRACFTEIAAPRSNESTLGGSPHSTGELRGHIKLVPCLSPLITPPARRRFTSDGTGLRNVGLK